MAVDEDEPRRKQCAKACSGVREDANAGGRLRRRGREGSKERALPSEQDVVEKRFT